MSVTDPIASYIGFHDKQPLPQPTSDMSADVFSADLYLGDKSGARIYLAGGCTGDQFCYFNTTNPSLGGCYCSAITASIYYFTPATNAWHTNLPPAPSARYRHCSAAVGNRLYLIGGRFLNDTIVKTIDIFDTVTGTWLPSVFWSKAVSDCGSFAVGSKVFVVGGYDQTYSFNSTTKTYGVNQFSVLNTATMAWDYSLPQLPTARGDVGVQQLGNRFYVLGGWGTYWQYAIPTVESFDPISRTWRKEPDMLFGRGDMAMGAMGDKLFAIGGETKNSTFDPNYVLSVPVPYSSRYTDSSQKWYVEANIPYARFRFTGASFNSSSDVFSSAIYLFGGQQPYDVGCQCFRISNGTIKYIPVSTYVSPSSPKKLSAGGIAGVVIAVVVVVGFTLVACFLFCAYRSRRYFQMSEDETNDIHPAAVVAESGRSKNSGFDAAGGPGK